MLNQFVISTESYIFHTKTVYTKIVYICDPSHKGFAFPLDTLLSLDRERNAKGDCGVWLVLLRNPVDCRSERNN